MSVQDAALYFLEANSEFEQRSINLQLRCRNSLKEDSSTIQPQCGWVSSEKHIWGLSLETEVQGGVCVPNQTYPEDRPAFNQQVCKHWDPSYVSLWTFHYVHVTSKKKWRLLLFLFYFIFTFNTCQTLELESTHSVFLIKEESLSFTKHSQRSQPTAICLGSTKWGPSIFSHWEKAELSSGNSICLH